MQLNRNEMDINLESIKSNLNSRDRDALFENGIGIEFKSEENEVWSRIGTEIKLKFYRILTVK